MPPTAGVLRPASILPIVTVHTAILPSIDVIISNGDPLTSIWVVGSSTAPGNSFAGINVAGISSASAGDYSCMRVVGRDASAGPRIARVNIGVGTTTGDSYSSCSSIIKCRSAASTVISGVRIRPGGASPCISGISPTSVNISAGVTTPSIAPGSAPAAGPVVTPWSPPRIIEASRAISNSYSEAPACSRTPGRSNSYAVGIRRTIPVRSNIRRIVEPSSIDDGCRRGRNRSAVVPGRITDVNYVRRRAIDFNVSYVVER